MLSTRIQLLIAVAAAAGLLLNPFSAAAGVVVTDGRVTQGRDCDDDLDRDDESNPTNGNSVSGTVASDLGGDSDDAASGADLDLDDLSVDELELYLLAAAIFDGHQRDEHEGRSPVPAPFNGTAFIIGDMGGDSAGGCAATPGVGLAAFAALGLLLGRRRRR